MGVTIPGQTRNVVFAFRSNYSACCSPTSCSATFKSCWTHGNTMRWTSHSRLTSGLCFNRGSCCGVLPAGFLTRRLQESLLHSLITSVSLTRCVSLPSFKSREKLNGKVKEHAPLNATLLASLIKTVQYTSNGSMVPFVRIPENSSDLVNYALNAGAGDIVRPHVQNAQQARNFVRLAKFPPLGDRSYPPMALFGRQTRTAKGRTVYDVWNEHTAVLCQIEDTEGVKNVHEIAQVPGGTLKPHTTQ